MAHAQIKKNKSTETTEDSRRTFDPLVDEEISTPGPTPVDGSREDSTEERGAGDGIYVGDDREYDDPL